MHLRTTKNNVVPFANNYIVTRSTTDSGVAGAWTGVDIITPLLPAIVPEIYANAVILYGESGKVRGIGLTTFGA